MASSPDAPTKPEMDDAVEFTSERSGYSFRLPSRGWRRADWLEELKGGADMALVHPDIGCLTLIVGRTSLSVADVFDGAEAACHRGLSWFGLRSKDRTTVAGRPAVRLEFEGIEAHTGKRRRAVSYFVVVDEVLIQIHAHSDPVPFPFLKRELTFVTRSLTLSPADMLDDEQVNDTHIILKSGLRWGTSGVVAGLALGIVASVVTRPQLGYVIAFMLAVPALVGIPIACYRWGAIGGSISGADAPLNQTARAMANVLLLPIRVVLWGAGTAGAAATRSRDFRARTANLYARILSAVTVFWRRVIDLPVGTLAGGPYAFFISFSGTVYTSAAVFAVLFLIGALIPVAAITPVLPRWLAAPPKPVATFIDRPATPTPTSTTAVDASPPAPVFALEAHELFYPVRHIRPSATSQRKSLQSKYSIQNTLDDRKQTAWITGAAGPGGGQRLKFAFAHEIAVSKIRMIAGHGDDRLHPQYHRLKRVRIELDGDRSIEHKLRDTHDWQTVALSPSAQTKRVELRVVDVYLADEHDALAIAEIAFVYEPAYLMPSTADKKVSPGDLADSSRRALRLIRNEIFARHGRPFKTKWIREYFEGKPWYTADPAYSDDRLSEVERQNAVQIRALEKKRK